MGGGGRRWVWEAEGGWGGRRWVGGGSRRWVGEAEGGWVWEAEGGGWVGGWVWETEVGWVWEAEGGWVWGAEGGWVWVGVVVSSIPRDSPWSALLGREREDKRRSGVAGRQWGVVCDREGDSGKWCVTGRVTVGSGV